VAEAKEKRISIFVPSPLHRAAKTKAADQGTSFQKILFPYFEQWTNGEVLAEPQKRSTGSKVMPDRWHQMLSEILESGDREAISAVQQNILVFHRIAGAGDNPAVKATKKRA